MKTFTAGWLILTVILFTTIAVSSKLLIFTPVGFGITFLIWIWIPILLCSNLFTVTPRSSNRYIKILSGVFIWLGITVIAVVFPREMLSAQYYLVPSASMEPTIMTGDLIWVHLEDRDTSDIILETDQIIVFSGQDEVIYVKRIKSIQDDHVTVYGENSSQSLRSSSIGKISKSKIQGVVKLVLINLRHPTASRVLKSVI